VYGIACFASEPPLTHAANLAALLPCAEAKGVVSNRLQNVVITLDKVKMVLAGDKQVCGGAWFVCDA
jgi:hypothetical protein